MFLHAIMRRIAGAYAERLIVVTGQVIRGTVYGLLGTAVVQGMLTAFGLWLAGVPRPVLLGAIAGLRIRVADRRADDLDPVGALAGIHRASGWAISLACTGWPRFRARTA